LAEDDDEIRSPLAAHLALDGNEVCCVPDGQRLVELLSRREAARDLPDAIVADYRMPGYSGADLLRAIARWNVPVIVISAFGAEVRSSAMDLGAYAVFQKPFDPDDLRLAVECAIDLRRARLPKQAEAPVHERAAEKRRAARAPGRSGPAR
jgi:two-component system response regulator HydG